MDRLIDDHRCICKNICDTWDQMTAARQILIIFDPRRCRCHPCFPNSASLGPSAIVKVPEQVGAAKSAPRKVGNQVQQEGVSFSKRIPSKGSQVPRNRFPSKVPRNRFPRKGCKKGFQEQARKQGVSRQGSWEQVSKQGSQDQVCKQASQEKVPKQGFEEQVRVPRTDSLGRFRAIGCQHGSHEHVPKHGFRLLMFPGTAFQEQLAKQNFEEHLQARLEARTESQARFRRTGS